MLYKRKKLANGKDDPAAPYWTRFQYRATEIRRSTGTNNKRLAEEFEKKLRLQAYEEITLGRKVYLWQDAADLFENNATLEGKKSLGTDRDIRKWFDQVLVDIRLDAITDKLVGDIRDTLLDETIRKATKREGTRSASSVNRMLSYLRSVLNHAVGADLLAKAPRVPKLKAPEFEGHNLTDDEVAALLAALDKTGRVPHVRAMAAFALETGLRYSNITGLKWSAVRLEEPPTKSHIYVAGHASKSGKPIGLPLSTRAAEIVREQQGKHAEYVFSFRGRAPIGSIKTAWARATRDAGLKGVRFHDLRHTWASRQVAKGVPLAIVAELGGWRDTTMLERRYAHLRRDDLARFVD